MKLDKPAFLIFVFFFIGAFPIAMADYQNEGQTQQFLELEKCYKGVRFSERYMAVSINSRSLLIQGNQQGQWEIDLKQELIDMQIDGDNLVVLLSNALEVWSLSTRQQVMAFETQPLDLALSLSNAGMVFDHNYFYIALNRNGILKFNKHDGKYLETITLAQGRPSALALEGNFLYILADHMVSRYHSLFPGIAIYDLNLKKIKSQVILDGAPTGAMTIVDTNVYIGNIFYWKLSKSKIQTKKVINTYSRVYIPEGGFARGFPEYTADAVYYCRGDGQPGKISLR